MSVLLRVLPLVAAVAGLLLPAGAQVPVKGGEVSDFDFAVGVVERAYAGYPDKTANRAAEYGALKERLRSGIASGRDTYDAVAEYLGWFDDSHLGTEGVRAYRPKSIRRPSDYAARMERYDPQFTHCRVDGETYLIRFPSCDLNEEQTAWVRTAVRAYLASGCENLILDIRAREGCDASTRSTLVLSSHFNPRTPRGVRQQTLPKSREFAWLNLLICTRGRRLSIQKQTRLCSIKLSFMLFGCEPAGEGVSSWTSHATKSKVRLEGRSA